MEKISGAWRAVEKQHSLIIESYTLSRKGVTFQQGLKQDFQI
jgi:hypothetical protein